MTRTKTTRYRLIVASCVSVLVAGGLIMVGAKQAVAAPLFSDGFEDGTTKAWNVDACTPDRVMPYTTASKPGWPKPPSGKYAARIYVEKTDVEPCTSNGTPRAQLLSPGILKEGMEVWEAWSIYFPADFPSVNGWYLFSQDYGSPYSGSPADEFGIRGTDFTLIRDERTGDDTVWRAPMTKQRWYRFVVHKKIAKNTTGFIELWVNGKQQMLNGSPRLMTQTMHSDANKDYYFYIASYGSAQVMDKRTTFIDDIRIGTTRADVDTQPVATATTPSGDSSPGTVTNSPSAIGKLMTVSAANGTVMVSGKQWKGKVTLVAAVNGGRGVAAVMPNASGAFLIGFSPPPGYSGPVVVKATSGAQTETLRVTVGATSRSP